MGVYNSTQNALGYRSICFTYSKKTFGRAQRPKLLSHNFFSFTFLREAFRLKKQQDFTKEMRPKKFALHFQPWFKKKEKIVKEMGVHHSMQKEFGYHVICATYPKKTSGSVQVTKQVSNKKFSCFQVPKGFVLENLAPNRFQKWAPKKKIVFEKLGD